jgi:hypothetical protein
MDVTYRIISSLMSSGFGNDDDVYRFAIGFLNGSGRSGGDGGGSGEVMISRILMDDFGWSPMDAHIARVGISTMVLGGRDEGKREGGVGAGADGGGGGAGMKSAGTAVASDDVDSRPPSDVGSSSTFEQRPTSSAPWKAVHVNDGAKMRRARSVVVGGGGGVAPAIVGTPSSSSPAPAVVVVGSHGYIYGMSDDDIDRDAYINLFEELSEYMSYMTVQRTSSSMTMAGGRFGDRRGGGLIREETAKVYMTHARLFLGWIVDARGVLVMPSEEEFEEEEEEQREERARPLDRGLSIHDGEMRREEGRGDARGGTLSSRHHPSLSHPSPLKSSVSEPVRKLVWTNVRRRTASQSVATTAPSRKDDRGMRSLRRSLSLCDIFPNPSAESSSPVLQYVLWLRSERGISQNYEANM